VARSSTYRIRVSDEPRTVELERCGSTQDELRALAAAGAPAFTVVRADVQDAGRGRRGRTWQTRPGAALLASVLLRPTRPPGELAALAIVGGLAAAQVARSLGVDARVRWPNDVVVGERKLAGVLAELVAGPAVLLGVGLNANATADDLPVTDGLAPTSLLVEGVSPPTPTELARMLVAELRPLCARFDEGGFMALRADADRLDALRGREVELVLAGQESVRGLASGFAADGALVLETPEGRVEHRSGHVARVHGAALRQSDP
jgi:BirA family transcriptional regulator, biotin operon repressor / biotin---[acetyl-CoA-carboxylase] ligase